MPNRSDIFIFVYNFSMLLGPVAQTFFINPEIQSKYKLDGVITVVDAAHIMLRLGEKKADGATNEALQQVPFFKHFLFPLFSITFTLLPVKVFYQNVTSRILTHTRVFIIVQHRLATLVSRYISRVYHLPFLSRAHRDPPPLPPTHTTYIHKHFFGRLRLLIASYSTRRTLFLTLPSWTTSSANSRASIPTQAS
jgi:hypothetical protein